MDFNKQVKESPVPVVVDFYTTYCPPCKVLAPIVEDVAGQYGEKIRVFKVDAMANPDLANQFQVRSVPTLLFMRDGEVKDRVNMLLSREDLVGKIEDLLAEGQ